MSQVLALPLPVPAHARKRTSSFSYPTAATAALALAPNPRPAKAARTSSMGLPLRRQETLLLIPSSSDEPSLESLECNATNLSSSPSLTTTPVPYYRTLQYYKDQRLKRKAVLNRNGDPMTISTTPNPAPRGRTTTPQQHQQHPSTSTSTSTSTTPLLSTKPRRTRPTTSTLTTKRTAPAPKAPCKVILPSISNPTTTLLTPRTTSPLAPFPPSSRPGRPVFPRSRVEPDLLKAAIKGCMAGTPHGRKVLLMGARLAWSIEAATRELERIVGEEEDGDVVMGDDTEATTTSGGSGTMTATAIAASMNVNPHSATLAMPVLTTSWVVVKGEDWEMVDCAA